MGHVMRQVHPISTVDGVCCVCYLANLGFQIQTHIMASFRIPALRHMVSGAAPYLRAPQRRWAQVYDVRFLATQQSDRILKKYKEKLNRKAKE
jgi:hypothetical protein